MKAKLGIAPIAWWNDDLPELSDDVSLEECLRQAREAGFTGMETGRRFPMEAKVLDPILKQQGMSVCGGWFSGLLLDGDIETEKDRIGKQMALFKAVDAPCIVYGETAGSIQGDRTAPLATKRRLSQEETKTYGRKLTAFAEWCAGEGMPIAYHHHMGAAIETEAEVDQLMNQSGKALPLLYDAGHMAFAGGDVLRVIDKHHGRISHVHTKDVRRHVIEGLDRTRESFLDAVVKGAFTVPGDGSLDFEAIVKRLAFHGYEGWFVVEAEQDPVKSPPLRMARIGHQELRRVMAASGYSVED
ncbi:myo-inosose-2 dehydratase [Mesorhizobium sp. WSM4307]|uniref:myo-inosose-2 dehydratase n=1 Tax=unclassified Mesorhizobium TaxID=325217 RepID=UPI000BB02FC6|nr:MULTISPECIES: myo-inosose-2 dehydratase [unclassified Mesorhizobium]PBB24395.1 myo-inosose-2 dehydratase [Mesorhizobium sp. WSM4304]PBB74637.1 myo-inosose-2 dehydratase [Mesorhizobium sp. WSM4308]TRC73196.1 myo-inosose-2 dehydratase [Mesorhizobium sp. WSM4315]TRC83473.1 myo-inosose-2 dehydratase [Mesorhizobium sp. WSM4307]